MKIQHTNPEWHLVRLALCRWDFKIQGNTWTILKHASGFKDDWQTHWEFNKHITGPAHGAYVDDLLWFHVERADQEFLDLSIRTVDGWRSPFDPEQYNWVLPHGILLLENHKQWKKMLAYVITQTWKPQLGPRLYRPLVQGNKGPGTIALEAAAKEEAHQETPGYGASSSAAAQAPADTPWWQSSRNRDTWTANSGSNFDVYVPDDTAPHLAGLPGPAPWNVSAAKVQTSQWQEHAQAPDRSCATNSVT